MIYFLRNLNNMFNKIRRKLWIRKYFRNRIMSEEVKLELGKKFVLEANEQKEKMIRAVEVEENWLKEHPDSHKYEDRQAKIRSEKKLRMLKDSLAGQDKQLEKGVEGLAIIRQNISNIEENGEYLKGRF